MTSQKEWKSCFRHDLLCGKVALVTGGGTGIGRAIAQELASIGAIAVIASRDEGKCREAAEEMNALLEDRCQGKVESGPSCSIRDEEQVENLVSIIYSSTYLSLSAP